MTRPTDDADPLGVALEHVSWARRNGYALSEVAGALAVPACDWDQLTWDYAQAYRKLKERSSAPLIRIGGRDA